MPRVLVTGAGGFIGAALAHRLVARGDETLLLGGPETDCWRLEDLRADAQVAAIDLCDAEAVDAVVGGFRPELMLHLAAHGAYSWQTSLERMVATNLVGLTHLADAAARYDVRALVNAGSSSEYGWKDHAPPESELPEPNSAYAFTKAAATLYCGWSARERGQALTTLRLYSVYGPWEEPRRLIPALVLNGMQRRLPPLVDPRVARDFVHVEDVIDAFLLAADVAVPGEGAVYNIGTGRQTTLGELAEIARTVFDIPAEPVWGDYPARSWDTDVWVADAGLASERLGWRPRWSLADGLAAMASWFHERPGLLPRYGDPAVEAPTRP
ncbi:NAD-dependent epimerase/dehydratase family protein [Conexibacter stalactiti]|uniref:NAD-dependent epimerase/dehydratase family protein n=1 Tax=Conexibacter stalactiti TaxID=1940611 RepID=A0ABU4HS56_9ACTN|nr:NAD-dependent epimerase/dehydratase family protein [Conexibacter stalactiti]MDW5596161.1 NAD-dependent epimerase/dehydratase family protein [Conexibacter stalactiti]MEC5036803.1 NAD-dependent epimerase/dehydratase family protein [Conexibacter stalactiti]